MCIYTFFLFAHGLLVNFVEGIEDDEFVGLEEEILRLVELESSELQKGLVLPSTLPRWIRWVILPYRPLLQISQIQGIISQERTLHMVHWYPCVRALRTSLDQISLEFAGTTNFIALLRLCWSTKLYKCHSVKRMRVRSESIRCACERAEYCVMGMWVTITGLSSRDGQARRQDVLEVWITQGMVFHSGERENAKVGLEV